MLFFFYTITHKLIHSNNVLRLIKQGKKKQLQLLVSCLIFNSYLKSFLKSYSSLLFSVVSVTFSRTSAKLTACLSFFALFFLSLLNCIFLNLFCLVFPSMSISGSVLVFSFVFLLLSNFDLMFSVLGKRLDSSSSTCISCSAAAVTGPVLAICQRTDIINFNNHTT